MHRIAIGLLLGMVFAGCGSATLSGSLRDDEDESGGQWISVTVRPGSPPVEVSDAEFRATMHWLAEDVHATTLARARPGSIVFVTGEPVDRVRLQLGREYQRWCAVVRHGPADCLSFGKDALGFDEKERLALSIALSTSVGSAFEAASEFMSPVKLEAMVVTFLASYLVLLYAPEPFSKIINAGLALGLYAYLGNELGEVVTGYLRMRAEATESVTFAEVQAAGERYGNALGPRVTRILIMLATARLANRSDQGMRMERLPGFQAASRRLAVEGAASLPQAKEGTAVLTVLTNNVLATLLRKGRMAVLVPVGTALMMAAPPDGSGGSNPGGGSGTKPPQTSASSQRIKELLQPGKRWIGAEGTNKDVRLLSGGLAAARKLFTELTAGGTLVKHSTYKGELFQIPGGGLIGLRTTSTSGPPTIDVMHVPDLPKLVELKFFP